MELNLLQRDAREAGLHEPNVWGGLVRWDLLVRMGKEWQPREQRVRAICRDLIADKQYNEALRTFSSSRSYRTSKSQSARSTETSSSRWLIACRRWSG